MRTRECASTFRLIVSDRLTTTEKAKRTKRHCTLRAFTSHSKRLATFATIIGALSCGTLPTRRGCKKRPMHSTFFQTRRCAPCWQSPSRRSLRDMPSDFDPLLENSSRRWLRVARARLETRASSSSATCTRSPLVHLLLQHRASHFVHPRSQVAYKRVHCLYGRRRRRGEYGVTCSSWSTSSCWKTKIASCSSRNRETCKVYSKEVCQTSWSRRVRGHRREDTLLPSTTPALSCGMRTSVSSSATARFDWARVARTSFVIDDDADTTTTVTCYGAITSGGNLLGPSWSGRTWSGASMDAWAKCRRRSLGPSRSRQLRLLPTEWLGLFESTELLHGGWALQTDKLQSEHSIVDVTKQDSYYVVGAPVQVQLTDSLDPRVLAHSRTPPAVCKSLRNKIEVRRRKDKSPSRDVGTGMYGTVITYAHEGHEWAHKMVTKPTRARDAWNEMSLYLLFAEHGFGPEL